MPDTSKNKARGYYQEWLPIDPAVIAQVWATFKPERPSSQVRVKAGKMLTLPLISLTDVMEQELEPISWVVEPLIAAGERVLVYGKPTAMKTWLLIHLGLHLAAGADWLKDFKVPRPVSVLYVDEEMNVRTLRRRIRLTAEGARFDADDAQGFAEVLARLPITAEMIIIESLRRVLVGNENEAWCIADFWRNVQEAIGKDPTFILTAVTQER
jgi:AAA domain